MNVTRVEKAFRPGKKSGGDEKPKGNWNENERRKFLCRKKGKRGDYKPKRMNRTDAYHDRGTRRSSSTL